MILNLPTQSIYQISNRICNFEIIESLIMNKENIKLLQGLSKEEKLDIVQLLWDDIANEPNNVEIPPEHKKIIEDRLNMVEEGNASFRSWNDIKKKYVSE